ncbi:MAG: ricin-type beta-trefoil lectin domain protein [Pseudomonadota bacterium]
MNFLKIGVAGCAMIAMAACSETTTSDAGADATGEEAATEIPEGSVEVTLLDRLDGVTSSFCLDIAGGNKDVDPANGLQAHTCYSYQGALGSDQAFDPAKLAEGTLYMPVYDVCATVASAEAGAEVTLAACDESEAQKFTVAETGEVSPAAAPEMCLTAGEESRFGRSDVHQIRDLSVESCSEEAAGRQQWGGRTAEEAPEAAADA